MNLLVTSFLPYVGILLNLIVNGVRCKKASDQYTKQFRMIRKNANILTTSFICFTYGFSMPILFLFGTVSLISQYIIDKILVTYFYKQEVLHNDKLTRTVIQINKFAPVIFFISAGATLAQNYCAMTNDLIIPLQYTN